MGDPEREGNEGNGEVVGNAGTDGGIGTQNATQHGSGAGVQPSGVTGEMDFGSQSPPPTTPLRGRQETTGVLGELAAMLPGAQPSIFSGVPPAGSTFTPAEGIGASGVGRGKPPFQVPRTVESSAPGQAGDGFRIGGLGSNGGGDRTKRRAGVSRDGSLTRKWEVGDEGGLGGMSRELMEQMMKFFSVFQGTRMGSGEGPTFGDF